jgi:5-methylthioadenosine/S-adenosylhomocysteine deaminase
MKIIHAGQVVADHHTPPIRNGAVVVSGNTIQAIGKYQDLAAAYPQAEVMGGERFLLMPGLINGHGHGRGLSDFQRGALDNTLETWLFESRSYIPVPVYDDLAYSAIRLLKSGVTTTMHNHLLQNPMGFRDEFEDGLRAFRDAGIRVQFNPAVRNQNPFIYGDNAAFLNQLPDDLRGMLSAPMPKGVLSGDNFVSVVTELYQQHHSDMSGIGFGPLAPQWCTDGLLREIAGAAKKLNTPVHVHAVQSIFQKIYGIQFLGKTLLEHMHHVGLLGDNVVIGHCVWPTAKDIDLLSRTGTGVTHHPSCNLRVRNGIAPVMDMLNAGVHVGLGLDGKSINDDDDMIEEMKVCFLLHRIPSLELDSPYLSARQVFRMATETNARLLGYGDRIGKIAPGALADLVLLDYEAMCHPFVDEKQDPIDVLLYRGSRHHVHTVMVDGRVVIREGNLVTIDEKEIASRLAEAASRPRSEKEKAIKESMERLRSAVRKHYSGWTETVETQPFFMTNSRIDGIR